MAKVYTTGAQESRTVMKNRDGLLLEISPNGQYNAEMYSEEIEMNERHGGQHKQRDEVKM